MVEALHICHVMLVQLGYDYQAGCDTAKASEDMNARV